MKKRKQVQESKQWIVDSLLDLMKTKSYEKITITSISINADLDRRTFYRHFNTKEDVLDYYIDIICAQYMEVFLANQPMDDYADIYLHFNFLLEHIDFFKLLQRQELQSYMLKCYQRYTIMFYENTHPEMLETKKKRFVLAFKIGGLWNAALSWMEEEELSSQKEMAEAITYLMKNGF